MFTQQQINEIAKRLEAMGKKDSQFPLVKAIDGKESISVLQNMQNKQMSVSSLADYLINTLIPQIQKMLNSLQEDLETHIDEKSGAILDSLTSLISQLTKASNDLTDLINQSEEDIKDYIDALQSHVDVKFEATDGKVDDGIHLLSEKINALENAINNPFGVTNSKIDTGFENVQDKLDSMVLHLDSRVQEILASITSALSSIKQEFAALSSQITSDINGVNTTIESAKNSIISYYKETNDKIDSLESNMETEFDTLDKHIEQTLSSIAQTIDTYFNHYEALLVENLSKVLDNIEQIFTGFEDEFYDRVNTKFNEMLGTLDTTIREIEGTVSDETNKVRTDIQSLQTAILSKIEKSKEELEKDITDLNTFISQQSSFIRTDIASLQSHIDSSILASQKNIQESLQQTEGNLELQMASEVNRAITEISDKLDDMQQEEYNRNVILTVVADTPGASVFINGVEQTQATLTCGELAAIRVLAIGYIPFNDTIAITKTQTVHIQLDEMQPFPIVWAYSVNVIAIPDDAKIVMNNMETSDTMYPEGTRVEITVSKEGYETYTNTIESLSENMTLNVNLQMPVTSETSSIDIASTGGSGELNITCAGSWSASSSDSWIIVSDAPRFGNGILSYTISENTSSARAGTITIVSEAENSLVIPVNQEGI